MTEQPSENPPSVSTLIGGIIADFQRLVRQEIVLARREITDEWIKTRTAAGLAGVGLVVLGVALLLFSFTLVKLIELAVPYEWACYGIVFLLFLVVGGALLGGGLVLFQQVHVVPPRTIETVRDDLRAVTSPAGQPSGSLARR